MIRFQCPHCRCVVASETWEPGAATICANCSKEVVMPVDRLSPGAVLGDFILYHKLGEGGMGRVYMAHQMSLDRPAAIKVLKAELSHQADSVQAFIREARSAAKLNHPSIVQAYAVGEEEGIFYFAMEYIDGKTMKDVLKEKGKLDPKEAANVVRQIADALDCAWTEQKLIHHDVKPENIMQCANDRVKLADLGLAGKQGDDANDDSDEVVGSMHYISPEQMTGVATDTRSDIYSLGATFYHLVTGQFPYTGENLDEVARQHVYGTLVPPKNVNPDLPQVLNDIIVKMMDKNPDGRFQNCKELSKALLNFIENGSEQKSAGQLGGARTLGGAASIGGGLAGGLGNGAQPRVLMPAGGSKLTLKIAGKKEEEKTPAAAETPAVVEAPAAEVNAAAEAPASPKPVIRLALKKPASEPVQSESANAETPEAADQDSAVAAAAESAVKADDLPAAADSENKNEDCEIETAEKSPEEAEKAADGKKKSKLIALIAGVVVVLLAAAGAGVWFYLNNVSENGKKEKTAETEPSSAVGKFVIPVAEVQETETPAKEPEVAEYKSPVAAKGPALSAFMKEANSLDALYLSNEAQFVQAWKRRGDKLKPKTAEEKKLYKALDENYVLADERVTVEPARKPLTAAYAKRLKDFDNRNRQRAFQKRLIAIEKEAMDTADLSPEYYAADLERKKSILEYAMITAARSRSNASWQNFQKALAIARNEPARVAGREGFEKTAKQLAEYAEILSFVAEQGREFTVLLEKNKFKGKKIVTDHATVTVVGTNRVQATFSVLAHPVLEAPKPKPRPKTSVKAKASAKGKAKAPAKAKKVAAKPKPRPKAKPKAARPKVHKIALIIKKPEEAAEVRAWIGLLERNIGRRDQYFYYMLYNGYLQHSIASIAPDNFWKKRVDKVMIGYFNRAILLANEAQLAALQKSFGTWSNFQNALKAFEEKQ